MVVNKEGMDLIKSYEKLRLKAYLCPAGVATIGYGATFYPSGKKVRLGESITAMQAEKLFSFHVDKFDKGLKSLLKVELNDNQYSALLSFAYNAGLGNLSKSTLLKKVNINPNDLSIRAEFMRWNKSNGKILNGLIARRGEEANLYFKPIIES